MTRGNKHNFIGMDIELVEDVIINTGMQGYINEAIETFEEDIPKGLTSSATSRLFHVTEGADKLSKEKAATFHSTVEKLLWIMKRSRPDIEAAICFIYTQVKDLDIHD